MDRKNIFFESEKRRAQEMAELESALIPTAENPNKAEEHSERRTTMCIAMSVQEKTMLKQYAAAQGKTTAAVIQGWIKEFCEVQ